MKITFASLGHETNSATWMILCAVFGAALTVFLLVRYKKYPDIETMVNVFLNECDRKKIETPELEHFNYFILGTDPGGYRVWASVRMSKTSINIWIERSYKATQADVHIAERFAARLKRIGYSCIFDPCPTEPFMGFPEANPKKEEAYA